MPHCRRSKSDHERDDDVGKGKDAQDPIRMMMITMMSSATANMTTEWMFMTCVIKKRRFSCLSTGRLISGVNDRAGDVSNAETKRLSLRDLPTCVCA